MLEGEAQPNGPPTTQSKDQETCHSIDETKVLPCAVIDSKVQAFMLLINEDKQSKGNIKAACDGVVSTANSIKGAQSPGHYSSVDLSETCEEGLCRTSLSNSP